MSYPHPLVQSAGMTSQPSPFQEALAGAHAATSLLPQTKQGRLAVRSQCLENYDQTIGSQEEFRADYPSCHFLFFCFLENFDAPLLTLNMASWSLDKVRNQPKRPLMKKRGMSLSTIALIVVGLGLSLIHI